MGTSASAAPPKLDSLFPAGGARGTKVTVTATGTVDPWPPQVWVSRPGVQVVPAKTSGTLEVTIAADAVPGVVWFRLATPSGVTQARPFIIGTLPEVLEEAAPKDPVQDQVLESSQVVVNGRLTPAGDVDVYSVPLQAGQTLVADMVAHRTLGSPMDPVMQILSAKRFVLEQNDDAHDIDPQLIFTAPATGRYLVRVFTFPSEPNSTIGLAGGPADIYRLTLTTGPFVDHAWPMAVPAVNPAPVRLMGWNIPELAIAAVKIDPARPDWLKLGTVQYAVGLAGETTANSVAVPLVEQAVLTEMEPNSPALPQVVTAPVVLTGRMDAGGDVDAYRFTAKKGSAWQVRIDSHGLGYPLDPVVTITDALGKVLATVDDVGGRDLELAFTAPADGDYAVIVKDLHGRGGLRYVYQLTIAPPNPDFSLTVAAESFSLTTGKPLEIPVTIERRAGFAETIDIVAEGLPAGVTATAGKSDPKGDSAKTVKLIFNGDGATSGPFRIIAKSGPRTRPALAASVIPTGFLADLWLASSKEQPKP